MPDSPCRTRPRGPGLSAGRAGFSLAEISIALFILALGLLAIIALFPAAMEFGGATIARTRAVSLAQTGEAVLRYTDMFGQLEGLISPPDADHSVSWQASGGFQGNAYCFPNEYKCAACGRRDPVPAPPNPLPGPPCPHCGSPRYYPFTMPEEPWSPYSWSAKIFQGGANSYVGALDKVYLVQIRIYRNYPARAQPVDLFELFMTR